MSTIAPTPYQNPFFLWFLIATSTPVVIAAAVVRIFPVLVSIVLIVSVVETQR